MKIPSDGHDVMFAGAGMVWGTVTVYRGVQDWRKSVPTIIFTGAVLAIGCTAYLIWSLIPL